MGWFGGCVEFSMKVVEEDCFNRRGTSNASGVSAGVSGVSAGVSEMVLA